MWIEEMSFLEESKENLAPKTKRKREKGPNVNKFNRSIDENTKKKMERKGRRRRRKKLPLAPEGSSNRSFWLNLLLLSSILIEFSDLGANLPLGPGRTEASQEVGEGLTLGPSEHAHLAENSNGMESLHWPLQQLDRIKSESKVSALVGQNVILNCPVQFKDGVEKPFVVNWLKYPHKLPIYIWYAGYPPHVAQGYENRVSRIGQASLNLTLVRQSDQGLYECKIYYLDRRPEDKGNGTWIFLDVQAPPHFTQTPAPVNYVQAGDSLHLTCQAESTPTPILRWYKKRVPIDSDNGAYRLSATTADEQSAVEQTGISSKRDHLQLFGGQSGARLDLYIDNIQAGATTGDYVCLASNSEGSIEAHSQVILAVPAVITTMPRNQTRLEGEKVELLCQAKALPSNITYKWLFNDKPIQTLKWFESRHSIKRDGTLVIHSLHRDDQGEYKCQATNGLLHRQHNIGHQSTGPAGNTKKSAASLELTPAICAEASAHLSVEYPARITYSPSVQYLPLGLAGMIRCFVQAAPPVEFFTWTLNNQQFDPNIDPNVERLKNGSLLVRQVSKQYEGKYRCTPFNKHGSSGSSSAMEIRVSDPPYFELKPAEFYKANVNGHVKIPCEGKGLPKPNVSWRRVLRPSTSLVSAPQSAGQIGTTISSSTVSPPLDKVADETEEQHLYGDSGNRGGNLMRELADENWHRTPAAGNPSMQIATQVAQSDGEEQQSVIVYAKLPSDRSEYKNSYLLLHGLRKEDHGRYECVIENEVATLVASTMLFIEETTPHAPTNVQVETKAWSAHITWTPGYDGGFEQSFVVWYRQVDRPQLASINDDEDTGAGTNLSKLPTPASPIPLLQSSTEHHELIDFNWRSVNVQPSDASQFTIQNLSQDTSYEFYVRAKNIIGEGPRSQVVLASTKRAISGSLTPVNINVDPAASTSAGIADELDSNRHTRVGSSPMPDDEENDGSLTLNPSVLGIIHLVDITTQSTPVNANNNDGVNDSQSSASQLNSVQKQQQQASDASSSAAVTSAVNDDTNSSNSSKVIRIIFPSKQTSLNSNDSPNSSANKRPRFDQTESSSVTSLSQPPNSAADGNSQTQVPIQDMSSAPQNVSIIKVAQGWVLNWWPPIRLPAASPSAAVRVDGSIRSQGSVVGGGLLPALSQVQSMQSAGTEQNQAPVAYTVEFREKGAAWQTLATSKERSLLLKDLKPGSEYMFRIFAHSASDGVKGAPSPEFKYLIPDNRRKPGSTQALSAGVVSGILFFIACIVIAVCAVNMCNKRRKKRAEKAAYVMMACPVLESHHDIAALNSNSLMKNSNSPKGRVSGVTGSGGPLAQDTSAARKSSSSSGLARLIAQSSETKARFFRLFSRSSSSSSSSSIHLKLHSNKSAPIAEPERNQSLTAATNRRIKFTSNAPLPVDVSPADDQLMNLKGDNEQEQFASLAGSLKDATQRPQTRTLAPTDTHDAIQNRKSPIDDYWVRKPSNRKWGTLTLAASKLAERRAREATAQLGVSLARGERRVTEVGPLACDYYTVSGSQTLPRSFRESPIRAMVAINNISNNDSNSNSNNNNSNNKNNAPLLGGNNLQLQQNQSHQQQFNSWLEEQVAGDRNGHRSLRAAPEPASSLPLKIALRSNEKSRHLWPAFDYHPYQQQWHYYQQVHHQADHQAELQSQFHQRSLSQVDPSTLTNYWLFQEHPNTKPPNGLQQQVPFTYEPHHQLYHDHHQHHQEPIPAVQISNSILPSSCELYQQAEYLFHQTTSDHRMTLSCTGARPRDALWSALGTSHQKQPKIVGGSSGSSLMIGKRNSLARSTLPLASLPNCGHIILAPPYHPSHELSLQKQQQQQQDPMNGATKYNIKTNTRHADDTNDDPVTENACLGSYKRKRRLPHIEAQFTITPPELPVGNADGRTAGVGNEVRTGIEDELSAARRERDAVENGHLFVRSLQQPLPDRTLHTSTAGFPASPRPRGLPQAGQRSEQRRLRPPPPLAQVETIGAREKIETYLRYYEMTANAQHHNVGGSQEGHQLTPPISSTPVEFDETLEELTFQPYHNLPSLKYTISLPLRKAKDGTLLLNETSHLRRSKSRRNNGSSNKAAECLIPPKSNTLTFDSSPNKSCEPRRHKPKIRLGSNSSCPAPPAEFAGNSSMVASSLELSKASRHSLESALGQPTFGHPDTMMGASSKIVDSLESSLNTMVQVRGDERPDTSLSVHDLRQFSAACQPFYLQSPALSPADYSSIRESLMVELPSPPPLPPPVPPHRIQSGSQAQTSVAADEQRQQESSDNSVEPMLQYRAPKEESDFRLKDAASEHHTKANTQMTTNKRDESNSSQSSSSSSSASASSATTTENGGAVSESLTNDHSVDENYEFDLVSSCSSSTHRAKQQQGQLIGQLERSPVAGAGLKIMEDVVQVNGVLYTQVNKQRARKKGVDRQVVERSHFYDYSMRKEQQLDNNRQIVGSSPQTLYRGNSNGIKTADYYDTVYEALENQCQSITNEQEDKSHPSSNSGS